MKLCCHSTVSEQTLNIERIVHLRQLIIEVKGDMESLFALINILYGEK